MVAQAGSVGALPQPRGSTTAARTMLGALATRFVPKSLRATLSLQKPRARAFSDVSAAAASVEAQYSRGLQVMHWTMAGSILACFYHVQMAMYEKSKPKEQRTKGAIGKHMRNHKSWGLLAGGLLLPRLALRVATKAPPHLPGNILEKLGGTVSHMYLYAMMTIMPVTGIAMGYYGGKGLPFFGYTIPGASEKNGKLAGQAFKVHKALGPFLEYFMPIHVGAVGYHHLIKRQNAMRRMNPFAFGK